jgi:hypothetical protein
MMIYWINSFDDPLLVLVNDLRTELLDGIVLAHLVANIACITADREKVFELLIYPNDEI